MRLPLACHLRDFGAARRTGGGVVVAGSYVGLGGAVAEIPVDAGLAGRDEVVGVDRKPGVEADAAAILLLQDQRAGPGFVPGSWKPALGS